MRKTSVLVVDAEPVDRKTIRYLIKKHPDYKVFWEATDLSEAANILSQHQPDLIFFDVELGLQNGFELIPHVKTPAALILCTHSTEHALRSYHSHVVDYILKPVEQAKFNTAIAKYEGRFFGLDKPITTASFSIHDRILLSFDGKKMFVDIRDIIAIRASVDFSVILLADRAEGYAYHALNAWEQQLPEEYFFRIHRSTIVNINYIRQIHKDRHGKGLIHLDGVPRPFTCSRNLYTRLTRFLRGRYSPEYSQLLKQQQMAT